MGAGFTFLDDVALADMAFDATGDDPQQLFEAATQALIESLADPCTVLPLWHESVTLEAADLADLLFDWLNQLVYLKDARAVVFREIRLSLERPETAHVWRLQAQISGAPVDATTQELRSDVKGVTKHLYAVVQEGGAWRARVVLDV
ncbi:MAG: archease [Nitrospiraceae bacterium]|nr:archease [Nitrospiraceae bacterium]